MRDHCYSVVGLTLVGLMVCLGRGIEAVEPKQEVQRAEGLVTRALEAEMSGDLEARQKLLQEAISLSEKFAPAQWHLGKILDSDLQWRDIDESIGTQIENKLLDQYERNRARQADTVESHWQLALWCAQNKLKQQCLAHLHRIIQIDTNHAGARNVLGHVPFAGQWLTGEDQQQMERRARQAQLSFAKYGDKTRALLAKILGGPVKVSDKARDELMAIRDPLAVATIESLAVGQSDPAVEIMVNWLDSIDDPAASQALVRFALLHPSLAIQELTAQKLKYKPVYDFVPELLTMLSGPVQLMAVPYFDRRGNFVGYRQAFAREGMNEVRLSVTDRGFQRVQVPPQGNNNIVINPSGDRRVPGQPPIRLNSARPFVQAEERAVGQYLDQVVNQMSMMTANQEVLSAQMEVARQNEQIRARNERIAGLISKVSDLPLTSTSQEIWKWWDEYNETNYQDYKPQRYNYDSLADRVPQYIPEAPVKECFIAGTAVLTNRGSRPIEQVAIGDMALSRDVESGRICWQPVVAVTFQPPAKTYSIQVGGDELTCTAGHLFWISGSGWKKASEIAAGDWMHGAKEPVQVSSVRTSQPQPTFNLEVLGQHTYFVGKNLVLSHDVTPRRTTRQLVPGYRPATENLAQTGKITADSRNLATKLDR